MNEDLPSEFDLVVIGTGICLYIEISLCTVYFMFIF